MKITVYLKYIITHSYILSDSLFNIKTMIPYTFDTLDTLDTSKAFELPINFNTIKNMMIMSYDAYFNIDDSQWDKTEYNPINITIDPNAIKGYLFTDESGKINIISIKGTSINFLPMFIDRISNSTVSNDKFNDNLYFSCCFYKENNIFTEYLNNCTLNNDEDKLDCSKKCYKESLNFNLNYINSLNMIINNIKKIIDFDNTNVIFTGHSLGGFIASILGIQYNKQVITIDSPGTKHYIELIGLDYKSSNVYNFGHTADSVMHGDCKTLCKTWGYNIETECHIGNTCIYDSKKKLGYFDGIRYHQLKWIIDYILPHWEDDFPECIYNKPCIERNCKNWNYN